MARKVKTDVDGQPTDLTPSSDLKQKKVLARATVERMKCVLEVTKLKDLAQKLGLGPTVPTAWIGAGHVPPIQVHKCSMMTNTSFDWLYHGIHIRDSLSDEDLAQLKQDVLDCLTQAVDFNMIEELQQCSLSITANKITATVIQRTGLKVNNSLKE